MITRFAASITATSSPDAAMLGRISRILPFSISTSPCAKSPTCGSTVSTTPPLSKIRRAPCTRASSASESGAPPCACASAERNVGPATPPSARPALDVRNCRRDVSPCMALLQRLDAYDPALVVDVPDRHRIGGVVDPGLAVDAVGLGQHVFRPLLELRVEAQIAAGMHRAGPDLAVPVDVGAVERGVGDRQAIFEDALL